MHVLSRASILARVPLSHFCLSGPTKLHVFHLRPDPLAHLSEMCQRGYIFSCRALILFTRGFRSGPPLLTSCERDLPASRSREALGFVSCSRAAFDYVRMSDSRGALNHGSVCAKHFGNFLDGVCAGHSRDTPGSACPGPHAAERWVVLVTFSAELCAGLCQTPRVKPGQWPGQSVKELRAVRH